MFSLWLVVGFQFPNCGNHGGFFDHELEMAGGHRRVQVDDEIVSDSAFGLGDDFRFVCAGLQPSGEDPFAVVIAFVDHHLIEGNRLVPGKLDPAAVFVPAGGVPACIGSAIVDTFGGVISVPNGGRSRFGPQRQVFRRRCLDYYLHFAT